MNPHFRAEILAMTTAELAREPAFDPGTQCEGGCGYAPEHCHCPADDQPALLEDQ